MLSERKQIPCRTYYPVGGRILLEMDAPKGETEGGLVIADSAKELPLTGTILAVAPELDQSLVGKKACWGNMYAIAVPKVPGEKDRAVLRFPQEVMFLFEDGTREESETEYKVRVLKDQERLDAAAAYDAIRAEQRAKIAASLGE